MKVLCYIDDCYFQAQDQCQRGILCIDQETGLCSDAAMVFANRKSAEDPK